MSSHLRSAKNVKTVEMGSGYTQYSAEETEAFSDFVNRELGQDKDLSHLLPISEPEKLFDSVKDGLLLCKMINKVKQNTIDERVLNLAKAKGGLNPWKINENHQLAINSAKAIGVHVINVTGELLSEGRPHIVLGLMWQIIRLGLTQNVNLKEHPELVRLLREGEELQDFLKLPSDEILLRWFNYQLEQAGSERRVKNFSKDISDSEAYTIVLNQISPKDKKCSMDPMNEEDTMKRAEKVLKEAEKIDCRKFVTPKDIVKGHPKLNFAFVANLFNEYPSLDPVEEGDFDSAEIEEFDSEGSREERAFRFWIQSLGIPCDNLYDAMEDGLLMLELFDKIEPNIVDQKRIDKKPRMKFHKIQNTNYCVEIAQKLGFSTVNISGVDINNKEKKLILGIVWQQMKYSLLKVLKDLGGGKKISDKDVLNWANEKVGDLKINSFHDKSISNGVFLCKLCHAVAPKSVNLDLVTEGSTEEDAELNAKYAISCARKIGATVFTLYEDILDVKQKMILAFIASLMSLDFKKEN